MVLFNDRRAHEQYEVSALDAHGTRYVTHGRDRREAGRSMAYHIATRHVPEPLSVQGRAVTPEILDEDRSPHQELSAVYSAKPPSVIPTRRF